MKRSEAPRWRKVSLTGKSPKTIKAQQMLNALKHNGYNQRDVARLLQTDRAVICRWNTGRDVISDASYERLEELCKQKTGWSPR
jgi:hypothetical protein